MTAEEYFEEGKKMNNEGHWEEAIRYYNEAIELNLEYADAFQNRGNAKYALQLFHEAIEDYTKAIELNPEYADPF